MLSWFQSQRSLARPFPRAEERMNSELHSIRVQFDKHLFRALIVQWLVVLIGTLILSAYMEFAKNDFLWTLLLVNGLLTATPLWFVLKSPGSDSTRMVVAVSQGLYSTLLLCLTSGQIETHLHLFFWLVALSLYREPSLLITASSVAIFSRLLVGTFVGTPELSAANASHLGEHTIWLVAEISFLIYFVRASLQNLKMLSRQEAALESLNNTIERKVERRTREAAQKMDSLQRECEMLRHLRDQAEANETVTSHQLTKLRVGVATHSRELMDATWKCPEARLPEVIRPQWRVIREASQSLYNLADGSMSAPSRDSESLVGQSSFSRQSRSMDGVTISREKSLRKRALLLIDDPVQQTLAVRVLTQSGFEVDVVHSGPRTYYSAMLREYHAILVDVDLSDDEGFDTIEAIRSLPHGIDGSPRLIAMSSTRSPDAVLRGTDLGIDAFLLKPITPDAIHSAMNETTESRPVPRLSRGYETVIV